MEQDRVFTRTCQKSLFWAKWIQPTPQTIFPIRRILILSFHLILGLPSDVFLSGFSNQNFVGISSLPHTPYMYSYLPAHPRLYCPNNIWRWEHIMELIPMRFSPASCTSSLLGPGGLLTTLFSNTLYCSIWLELKHLQISSRLGHLETN
jgi:hypothetical protein